MIESEIHLKDQKSMLLSFGKTWQLKKTEMHFESVSGHKLYFLYIKYKIWVKCHFGRARAKRPH